MGRYIFRYRGKGATPADDVARIRRAPDMRVLDDSGSRMFLVEAPEEVVRSLDEALPNWLIIPERMTPLPAPHPTIKEPA